MIERQQKRLNPTLPIKQLKDLYEDFTNCCSLILCNSCLILNSVISGCCTPAEFILFNKNTGRYIKNFGPLIYYNDSLKYPLLVSVNNNGFNALKFYNVETKRQFTVSLPKDKIMNTLKIGSDLYPEFLF